MSVVVCAGRDCIPAYNNKAISYQDRKEWLDAITSEINELIAQGTWRLVDLPPGRRNTKGRWVYKLKPDQNGNILKYKARWVVKGFP
jgi:Reverse transcriptase (RNA-dependent DNA polymerase)